MNKFKLGDEVNSISPHHKNKLFEIVFIKGDEITCLYRHDDERKQYRIITKAERLIKL
jgi:hypothetical protein